MSLLLLLHALAQSEPAPPAAPQPAARLEAPSPRELPGYVDLHIHIAAHLAVPIYGKGPDSPIPEHQSAKHALRPQIFTEQLAQPGPSILVSLAYANPFTTDFESRRSMRARIERQLDAVDSFAARHSEHFAIAKSPEEARDIVASGRKAIVHGIEGATKVHDGAADAQRWAARGVAVVTPVHLADNYIGGAWCQGGSLFLLNVPGCWRELFAPQRHGLTKKGALRVAELIEAGILVDLAHSSHASFADLLPLLRQYHVAPVYTHAIPAGVRRDPIAMTDQEYAQIRYLGGLVAVTSNRSHLRPHPVPDHLPTDHCAGSVDDFRLHWDYFVSLAPQAALAWGSDFQGGVDHPRPIYGREGCLPLPPGGTDDLDVLGLAHPGLVEPMFAKMAAQGADRSALDRSAEAFLQIWARARAAARPPQPSAG